MIVHRVFNAAIGDLNIHELYLTIHGLYYIETSALCDVNFHSGVYLGMHFVATKRTVSLCVQAH